MLCKSHCLLTPVLHVVTQTHQHTCDQFNFCEFPSNLDVNITMISGILTQLERHVRHKRT
jgi:hypothetical protein